MSMKHQKPQCHADTEDKYQRLRAIIAAEISALASFKPRVCLVNYVQTAFAAHDSVIAVALA